MKLVCFSNNTAGGLVCDLLNNHTSSMVGYRTDGLYHNAFKIGDVPGVQWTVNPSDWTKAVSRNREMDHWLGTHLHPSGVPDLSIFTDVIAITTCQRQSKIYRWLRYYYGWFQSEHPEWVESDDLADIDKIRELAKNVFEEFTPYHGCTNVEFADIVNGNFTSSQNLDNDHFQNWRNANSFLDYYSDSWAYQRFCEAEWELSNQMPYKYI
jgi:hypothetical protein